MVARNLQTPIFFREWNGARSRYEIIEELRQAGRELGEVSAWGRERNHATVPVSIRVLEELAHGIAELVRAQAPAQ